LPAGKALNNNIVDATASVKSVAIDQGVAISLPAGKALNTNIADATALGKSVAINQGVATSLPSGKALNTNIVDATALGKSVAIDQGVATSLPTGRALDSDNQIIFTANQSPDITNVIQSQFFDKTTRISEKNPEQTIKLEQKRKITEVKDYLIKKYTTHRIFDSLSAISNTLSLRLDFLKQMPMLGVAAGDKIIEKGFWIKGFNSRTQQKNIGNNIGFKIRQEGIVIGADAEIKDNFVAGIAYTNINSKTRFKGLLNDIEKSSMHVASIYTEHNLSPKFLLNTYWHYAEALINHQINSNILSESGKTSGEVFRGSVEAIYGYHFDDWIISPKLGGVFDCFSIQEFTEKIDSFDINVPSRSGDKFSVTTGIEIKKLFSVNSINIVPKLHFNVDQILLMNHSASATLLTFGADTPEMAVVKLSSPYKTTYNLGGYINMSKSNQVKVGVGYDYYYKKGFNNHSSYLNLYFKF
jgi:outer membrane autotransporter protein